MAQARRVHVVSNADGENALMAAQLTKIWGTTIASKGNSASSLLLWNYLRPAAMLPFRRCWSCCCRCLTLPFDWRISKILVVNAFSLVVSSELVAKVGIRSLVYVILMRKNVVPHLLTRHLTTMAADAFHSVLVARIPLLARE